MRILVFWLFASFGLVLAGLTHSAVLRPGYICRASHVVDGDTLHLTCNGTGHKVRLLGYDTPETHRPLCPAEKLAGDQATDLLRRLVRSAPVTGVEFKGHDRYGRDLANVEIGGQDVSTYMLASPLARPYQGHKHPDWCAILGA